MVEKPKFTMKPTAAVQKPAQAVEKPEQKAATAVEKVSLRAKKDLSEFEKGFLAGVDAAQKTAFEHERAKSVGTPITDAIQKLEPE